MKTKQPPSLYLMLAAIENLSGPKETALQRAVAVIDEGVKAHPDSVEMIRAKSRVTRLATGDPDKAIAVVEERAKADKDGTFRRLLADVYREENRLAEGARRSSAGCSKENPDDTLLMTSLVRIVASQAAEAGSRGDAPARRRSTTRPPSCSRAFRAKNPKDLGLAEVECDLAARRGDLDRATAITKEIDLVDPNSPVGPLLRAKIQAARGNAEAVADAYEEASSRRASSDRHPHGPGPSLPAGRQVGRGLEAGGLCPGCRRGPGRRHSRESPRPVHPIRHARASLCPSGRGDCRPEGRFEVCPRPEVRNHPADHPVAG